MLAPAGADDEDPHALYSAEMKSSIGIAVSDS